MVGDVTSSEDIALEDVMNPKMRERLSARQRAELGIEEEVAPEEEVEEERLTDSQIPKSKTTYTAIADDDTTNTIEVTTRLDGSRDILYKNEQGGVYQREKVSPDNTLTNEEYISNVVGDITGSEDISLENVINPKMRERLSARQRAELGIEEEVVPEEAAPEVEAEVDELEDLERALRDAS
jgi:hypothetical protein